MKDYKIPNLKFIEFTICLKETKWNSKKSMKNYKILNLKLHWIYYIKKRNETNFTKSINEF